MTERVGLKLTLIARSSVSATAMATPRMPSTPMLAEITSRLGSASSIRAASTPPIRMNGLRRPFQNQTRSLITPINTCPIMPASGPAAQTRPTSWISSPYWVVRIQLSAEIWMERAKPIAVDGRLIRAKKPPVLFFWNARMAKYYT
jgi:hypothetical protein